MNRSMPLTLAGLLAGLTLAAPAGADHYTYANTITQRLETQDRRIEQGVASGELTAREARILREEHRHIRRLRHIFVDDGHLSRRERAVLRHKLQQADRHIRRTKHNFLVRHDMDEDEI